MEKLKGAVATIWGLVLLAALAVGAYLLVAPSFRSDEAPNRRYCSEQDGLDIGAGAHAVIDKDGNCLRVP